MPDFHYKYIDAENESLRHQLSELKKINHRTKRVLMLLLKKMRSGKAENCEHLIKTYLQKEYGEN